MIIGIGTDLVRIKRIKKAMQRNPQRFAERVLHPNELTRLAKHTLPYAYVAKRFAAKEALSKALGTGIAKGVNLQDIEVFNDDLGKPGLRLHGKTKVIADEMGVLSCYLSLSDEKKYAQAYVVLEAYDEYKYCNTSPIR